MIDLSITIKNYAVKIDIEIIRNKEYVDVIIRDGLFESHNVLKPSKSLNLAVAKTISKHFKEYGFLD